MAAIKTGRGEVVEPAYRAGLLLEPDRDRAGVGVELLHRAEGLDVGPHPLERAGRILDDAGAPEKLVDGQSRESLGRAAGRQDVARPPR